MSFPLSTVTQLRQSPLLKDNMSGLKVFGMLLIGLMLSALSDVPRSFEVIGESVKTVVLDNAGKLELIEIKFLNTTNNNLELKWTRLENTFPKQWDYSMCAFGKCQVGIPKGGVLRPVHPGKSGFLAIHVLPKGSKGEGVVKFRLFDPKDERNGQMLEFRVRVK